MYRIEAVGSLRRCGFLVNPLYTLHVDLTDRTSELN